MSRTRRPALLFALTLLPATAFAAAADLDRGSKALKAAYEQTDGDEGGFGGTLIEQCRSEGDAAVRCVAVDASGNSDLDGNDYSETRAPLDFAIATFGADGTITTRREPFAAAPRQLDADIRVPTRIRRTKFGRIVVKVSPDVPALVTVAGFFGAKEIERRRGRSRTVEVVGGRTSSISLDLTTTQRRRIRTALRDKGSISALISVRVIGDVGPAGATEYRLVDSLVVG